MKCPAQAKLSAARLESLSGPIYGVIGKGFFVTGH